MLFPCLLMAQAPSTPPPSQPAAPAATAAAPAPDPTEDAKTAYALGLLIYSSLESFDLSADELAQVQKAITDAAAGKPALSVADYRTKIQAMSKARSPRVLQRQKTAAKAYLDKMAAEPGAVKTESGLIYKEVKAGTGDSPKPTDTVKVNYRGTLTDGTEFDSSYRRNEPAQFPLNRVIKCWTEGVQKMKPGGKAMLGCPSELAYGDRGFPPQIQPGATLVFEVELLEVVPPPPAPAAPPATFTPAKPATAPPAPATTPAPK